MSASPQAPAESLWAQKRKDKNDSQPGCYHQNPTCTNSIYGIITIPINSTHIVYVADAPFVHKTRNWRCFPNATQYTCLKFTEPPTLRIKIHFKLAMSFSMAVASPVSN